MNFSDSWICMFIIIVSHFAIHGQSFNLEEFSFGNEYPEIQDPIQDCKEFPISTLKFCGTKYNWISTSNLEGGIYNLTCYSKHQLILDYDGEDVPEFEWIHSIRYTNSNVSELENSCFVLDVSFHLDRLGIGQYWCSRADKTYKLGWNVYKVSEIVKGIPKGVKRVAIDNAKELQYESWTPVKDTVELRCPWEGFHMLKDNNTVLPDNTNNHQIKFDSFTYKLNISAMEDPLGTYNCARKMHDDNSTTLFPVELNFARIFSQPEFDVHPNVTKIYVTDEILLVKFICRSRNPNHFIINYQNGSQEDLGGGSDLGGSDYKYNIKYIYKLPRNCIDSISCINSTNGNVYHQWKIEDYDPGIVYDSYERVFFCPSSGQAHFTSSEIIILRCDNLNWCNILAKACFDGQENFKGHVKLCASRLIIQDGESVRCGPIGTRGRIACAYVGNSSTVLGFGAGLAHCKMFDENNQTQVYQRTFFKTIDFSITGQVIMNWEQDNPGTEKYLQILTLHNLNRIFYVQDFVEVKCIYSTFIFSAGVQWKLRLKSTGTIVRPTNLTEWGPNPYNFSDYAIQHGLIQLDSTDIDQIVCAAPLSTSNQWKEVSIKIRVQERFAPTIIQPIHNINVNVEEGQTYQLICTGSGDPLVDITWIRQGNEIVPVGLITIEDNVNDNLRSSIVNLYRITKHEAGTYICSVYSKDVLVGKRSFQVTVFEPLNTTFIITIIVGTIIIIFILLVAVLCIYRQRLHKQAFMEGLTLFSDLDGFRLSKKFLINKEDLRIGKYLGAGCFSRVYEGYLTTRVEGYVKPVAVKIYKSGYNDLVSLARECTIMENTKPHPSLLALVGVVQLKRELRMVVELCEPENLRQYLRANSSTMLKQVRNGEICRYNTYIDIGFEYTLQTVDLIRWAAEIAAGLTALKEQFIIHCDIAARNILLTTGSIKQAKISDFGHAKKSVLDTCISGVPNGYEQAVAWKWASPDSELSPESDIWSFGILLWEIFTLGCDPFETLEIPPHDFFSNPIYHPIQALEFPPHATNSIYYWMKQCFCLNPKARISSEELQNLLENEVKSIIGSQFSVLQPELSK